MKSYSVFLLVTFANFVMAATVAAEVPNIISYQGRLTTPAGTPVPDASYTAVFSIYDAGVGGTTKWTETQSITTTGGLFSVQLGSVTPVGDTVFNGTTRYLGITIEADPELTPRTALVAVPYAHRVSTVDGATGGTISGNVGIGAATPLRRLHIGTGTTVNNVFSDVLLNFADGDDHYYEVTNTSGFGLFGMGGSSTNIVGSGNLRFSPGAHTAVTMTSSGYVGVGTADPWDKLHVAGTIRADQFRGPLVVNGGNITYAADGGDHIFSTAVQERMRVTVGGNVGIGTISPAEKLTVAGVIQSTSGGVKFPDGTIQTAAISTHYVGESYGGGIVFYVYDNGQHGLIGSTSDQTVSVHWGVYSVTFSRGDGIGAGLRNTSILIARHPAEDPSPSAAKVCSQYSVTSGGVTYGDWYLPSLHELRLLYAQRVIVGGFSGDYWSSNEDISTANGAWRKRFSDGAESVVDRYSFLHVRAIRSF